MRMETQTATPTRTTPAPVRTPETQPQRRYNPGIEHCPGQRVRTVRRIRRVLDE